MLNTNVQINGVSVPLFQLLQWKHALKLESKGLKMSRGRSVTAHVKRMLKLKGSNEKVRKEFWRIMELVEHQIDEMAKGLARNETQTTPIIADRRDDSK